MIGTTLNLVSKYREQKFCFRKKNTVIVMCTYKEHIQSSILYFDIHMQQN